MEIGDWLGSLIEDCGIELEIGDYDWRLGIGIVGLVHRNLNG